MRYLKYIEGGFGIIMALVIALYVYQVDTPKISLIGIIIALDLITKTGMKHYAKQLQDKGKIVLIAQNNSKNEKIVSLIFLFITIAFITTYIVNKQFNAFTLNEKLGVLLPLYILFNSILFNNYKGKFYVSKYGFIQPKLLSKNYSWKEIKKLELKENTISFRFKNKDYVIPVAKEKINTLKQLTEQWRFEARKS